MRNLRHTLSGFRAGMFVLMLLGMVPLSLDAAVILVPTDQATIQDAINAAAPGDTVRLEIASSPFVSGLITIPVAKTGLVLDGQGSTISSTSASWGVSVAADNVVINDLTIDGAGTFGLITGSPATGGNFMTLNNVTVTNGGGTGFAITGVNDVTMNNVTSMNNGGNGMSITSIQNMTINGYTSSGNMFGGGFSAGIGIFSCETYMPCNTDNINLTGTVNISEPVPIYTQDNVCGMGGCGAGTITNLNLNPANVSYTHVFGLDGDEFYSTSLMDALIAADAQIDMMPAQRDVIYVEEIATGNKFVAPANIAAADMSIQAAIDFSVDGDTVYVLDGTITEGSQIRVDRDITVIGAGKTMTTLSPGYSTGTAGDLRGWFVVEAGVEFNMSDLTLDGSGFNVYQGIRHQGSGDFNNIAFTQIQYNASGPEYQGVAIAAFGNGNVNVYNSMFTDIGRIGVLYFGSGITSSNFDGNMYTGKGDGNFLDYMLDISAGAIVNVTDNSVMDNRGVAAVDGSTSAGILVSTFFAPGTQATITGNIITNNTTGIAVGFDASDESVVTANNNDIYDNTSFGVVSTAPVVDATLNYWGDPSGPSGEGFGTGDAVSDNVNFCPWLEQSITSGGAPVFGTGDVSLACNDRVNISLDENCRAILEADMLLEGEPYPNDEFDVEVWLPNGNIIPNAVLTGDHVGMTLNYKVTHTCSRTTCWGTLFVEDKQIPDLVCRDTVIIAMCGESIDPEDIGFPLDSPFTAIRVPGQDEFVVSGFDPCGDVWLRYEDEVVKNGCGFEYYTEITRKWSVEDASGNTATCVEMIGIEPGSFSNVVFPPDYNGFDRFALECDDRGVVAKSQPVGGFNIGWNDLANGHPSPYDKVLNANDTLIGTGFPAGVTCDHLAVSYKDRVIETCGENTYKLFREWRVYDWCTGEDSIHIQSIKVVDTRAPEVICPTTDPIIVPTTPWTCTGTFIVQDPIFDPNFRGTATVPVILRECNNYKYEVRHKVSSEGTMSPDECAAVDESETFFTTNVRQLPNGQWEVFDMPQGCNWIKYIITDDCGNSIVCGLELFVQDTENPVAVCDEHTVVSLNEDGEAKLCATAVDNGSQDNCTAQDELTFQIKKMGEPDNLFRDCVDFTCADVAISPLMVVFRVYDKAGNYNDCMVETTIQDKIPPSIECPDDITLNCDQDYLDDALTGIPVVDDQCGGANLTSSIVREEIDDCGIGYVIKRWRVEDNSGRFALCDQRIDLIDPDPFDGSDIIWPQNYTLNGCELVDAHPNNLPIANGYPRYNNVDCAKPVSGYEDEAYYNIDGYCIKIFRTWEVIDWCQYDIINGTGGRWTYVQTIFVVNNEAPVIVPGTCEGQFICADQDCNGLIEMNMEATDDCTASEDLEWSYEVIDVNNGNTVIETGLGPNFSEVYPRGYYRINWTVKDACGNEGTCTSDWRIRDCKEPTPYCKPGIVTTIMPSAGYVDVWASDFNDASFDNCTDTSDLRFSFSEDLTDTSRRIDCDSLDGNSVDTFTYRMYVTDLDGNFDYCTVTIIVQDNQGVCGNAPTPLVNIGGEIRTEEDEMVEAVKVDLMEKSVYSKDMMTGNDGKYAFQDLPMDKEYSIVPKKNDDYLNGVSTADLVHIQRHLLGKQSLGSAYKHIAADANGTNSISAADIATFRKLILGVIDELPNGVGSWRFVDASHVFTDPTDPWLDPFHEDVSYNDLTNDQMKTDFIGLKVGDVTGDAQANGLNGSSTRNAEVLVLNVADDVIAQQEGVRMEVKVSEAVTIEGFQMTLELNDVIFDGIESEVISMTEGNYHMDVETQTVTVSWNGTEQLTLAQGEVLFTILGQATENMMSHEAVKMSSNVIRAEAYVNDMEVVDLQLAFERESREEATGLTLYQNIPNPFTTGTVIPFELPKDAPATLTVFDVTGKIQVVIYLEGRAGYNEFDLNVDQLNKSGVLYYQLESNQEVATKRMLLLNR